MPAGQHTANIIDRRVVSGSTSVIRAKTLESKDQASAEMPRGEQRKPWLYLAILVGLTMIISSFLEHLAKGIPLGFTVPFLNEPATVSMILYHLALILVGGYVGILGLKELVLERRFSVEFLMAVAAMGAAYLDFLFEGAMVLFLYSVAEHFEGYIEDRARKTIEKLTEYMPDMAKIIQNGTEESVRVREIKPGMALVVRPGERIPLDGIVTEGSSHVDQSIVTGESTHLSKREGDIIYAGTLNIDGVIKVNVTKSAEETLVSRVVKLVIESRKRKASIEKLVDRFARVYVPIVILFAILTAVLAPTVLGGPTHVWLYRSLTLLVVSCPSAFVMSVPATIFTAITVAARRGVIFKGGLYVEKMARTKTVVFDKTGTLTLGHPTVVEVTRFADNVDKHVLTYVAALEQYSRHPMAEALVNAASEQGLDFRRLHVENVQEVSGKGIVGIVEDVKIGVGNNELMRTCSTNHLDFPDTIDDKHSCVFVSINDSITSAFCLADDVRHDAVEAVKLLRSNGVRTVMLTGDKASIAKEIAGKLEMDEVYAELLPEGKLKIIDSLKVKHGLVAMVGDGVNDAPALAASDVGIAMGGSGVDVALESADIVLVNDELVKIPYLRKLSQQAVKISKQNIAASLGVKIAIGALGFLGIIPLWFAVAAGDDGVTMLLLLNTLRLMRVK